MKLKTLDGNELGLLAQLRREGDATVLSPVSRASTGDLNNELVRRKNVVPFLELADRVALELELDAKGVNKNTRLVYERELDVLRRPNVWLGYKVTNDSLDTIVEEDSLIRGGLLPRRESGKPKIVWTDRLVVHENSGIAAPYATGGDAESQDKCVADLVRQVKAINTK